MEWLTSGQNDYINDLSEIRSLIENIPAKPELCIQPKRKILGLFRRKDISIQDVNTSMSAVQGYLSDIYDRNGKTLIKLEKVYIDMERLDKEYASLISKTYKTAEGAQQTAAIIQEDSTNNMAFVEYLNEEMVSMKKDKASWAYVMEENRKLSLKIRKAYTIAITAIGFSFFLLLLNVIGII